MIFVKYLLSLQRYDSHYRSNSGDYYDCPSYDDYYDDSSKESKRCSHCKNLKIAPSQTPASIRYNTLSNGCRQALISCPKKGLLYSYMSVERRGRENVTLALGKLVTVVAKCRSDKKWYANTIGMQEVELVEVTCFPAPQEEYLVPPDFGLDGRPIAHRPE
ncbi:hypothetical protein KIN20_001554 [Parelaphostrongylus tenuis]|uniref:Uncharacterized protein n=1 Tax=Parelaphostrongylus tenuis TaxID=148309 RepID=A0AAD5MF37_PARTN|nr:hypothetical protein KIN20_001554 [Parelaphostrongylus tenuis]